MGSRSEVIFNPPAVPPPPIIYSDYCDNVRIPAAHVVSIGNELELAKPDDADAGEVAALKGLLSIGEEIEATVNERADFTATRPYLLAMQNCFGAISDALVAKTRLPVSMGPEGEEARVLYERVFPDGMMWMRGDARSAWFHAHRTYRRIVSLGLKEDLERMVGASFVAAAKKSTNDLGEAMGWGKTQRELPSRNRISVLVTRASRQIAKYCRLLAAKVEEDDPRSVDRFRKAVQPIDEYRASQRPGRVEEPEADEPEAPLAPSDPSEPSGPLVDPGDEPPTT